MRCFKILFCCCVCVLFGLGKAKSQLYKIDLDSKIKKSSLIIEGTVSEQHSFWNAAHTMIYTASEINISGILKGSKQLKVEVVTQGGSVGNYAIKCSDLLELRKGQKGIFFCYPNQLSLTSPITKKLLLDVYSSKQGFLKYNLKKNEALAPFARYANISSLKLLIAQKTGTSFQKIAEGPAVHSGSNPSNGTAGTLAATISSFAPTTVNAGTFYDSIKNTLTINGSGFGATPSGDCAVLFKDADSDDNDPTFTVDYTSPYFIKWSNNQIIIHVPDQAGTGPIGVQIADGTLTSTVTDLDVFYSVQNATFDIDGETVIKEPRLANTDGKGGYTLLYGNSTAGSGADITKTESYQTFKRALNTWKELTGVNITEGGNSTVQKIDAYDGNNMVLLDNTNTGIARLAEGVLATTYSGFSVCPSSENFAAQKAGFDVLIRNTGVSKGNVDFTAGPCFPTQNEYDLENTILHELGHALNLGHIVDDYQVTGNNYNNVNPSKLMHYAILDFVDRRSPDASAYQGALYAVAKLGKTYGNCEGIFPNEMTLNTSLTASNDECPSSFPTATLEDNTNVFFDLTHSTSNKFGDPSFTQVNCQGTGTSVTNNAYYAFKNGSNTTLNLAISNYTTSPAELDDCSGQQSRLALYDVSACPVGQQFPAPVSCLTFAGDGTINFSGLEANHAYLLYADGVRNTKASFNMLFNSNGNPVPTNELTVELYPNPVHYTLNVKLTNATAGKYEYAVFDIMGRVLTTSDLNVSLPTQTFPVIVANAATGIYFIRINDSNGKTVAEKKIFKY